MSSYEDLIKYAKEFSEQLERNRLLQKDKTIANQNKRPNTSSTWESLYKKDFKVVKYDQFKK
tara:strand:- start:179 stop:364 length:186 start_codon:yes stop_codon:yes gene_type:complete